jgi:hypothetical protein
MDGWLGVLKGHNWTIQFFTQPHFGTLLGHFLGSIIFQGLMAQGWEVKG